MEVEENIVEYIKNSLNSLRYKLNSYLIPIEDLYDKIHNMRINILFISKDSDIQKTIDILNERVIEIIIDMLKLEIYIDNRSGDRVRTLRSLKMKMLRSLTTIIKATYASNESHVMNYLLTKRLKNFNNTIEVYETLIKKVDDDINENREQTEKTNSIQIHRQI